MERILKVGLILLPAVIFCTCQTEEVADLSEDVKTTDVVIRFAASSSQAEAEAAVRSLIVKAEIGETSPGSMYELYTSYQNGDLLTTLGRTFEAIMYIADHIPVPKMGSNAAMSMLAEETEAAFADPDEPGNALLEAIASRLHWDLARSVDSEFHE